VTSFANNIFFMHNLPKILPWSTWDEWIYVMNGVSSENYLEAVRTPK